MLFRTQLIHRRHAPPQKKTCPTRHIATFVGVCKLLLALRGISACAADKAHWRTNISVPELACSHQEELRSRIYEHTVKRRAKMTRAVLLCETHICILMSHETTDPKLVLHTHLSRGYASTSTRLIESQQAPPRSQRDFERARTSAARDVAASCRVRVCPLHRLSLWGVVRTTHQSFTILFLSSHVLPGHLRLSSRAVLVPSEL
jgi:hypothetical protein